MLINNSQYLQFKRLMVERCDVRCYCVYEMNLEFPWIVGQASAILLPVKVIWKLMIIFAMPLRVHLSIVNQYGIFFLRKCSFISQIVRITSSEPVYSSNEQHKCKLRFDGNSFSYVSSCCCYPQLL